MILSYESYLILEKSEAAFESEWSDGQALKTLTKTGAAAGLAAIAGLAGIASFIGSRAKALKVKKQLKEYQQLMMKDVLIEIEYLKKKSRPSWKKLQADKKQALEDAKKKAREAIAEQLSLVDERINNMASTEYLRKVASNGRLKAKLMATNELTKYAEGQYQVKLKQRSKRLKDDIQSSDAEVKKLEAEAKAKAAEAEKKSKDNKQTQAKANAKGQ
jgi:hypothetical protein